jgi:hypothetical protein
MPAMQTISAQVVLRGRLLVTFLVFQGCVGSRAWYESKTPSVEQQSALDIGMTESSVVNKLGAPTSVSVSTCGQDSRDGAWHCRILTFGACRLYFQRGEDLWVLNSWSCPSP